MSFLWERNQALEHQHVLGQMFLVLISATASPPSSLLVILQYVRSYHSFGVRVACPDRNISGEGDLTVKIPPPKKRVRLYEDSAIVL
jgi:hypothetical protein